MDLPSAQELDSLNPLDRQMYDFHSARLVQLQKEFDLRDRAVAVKAGQANALREMSALVATGLKKGIQDSIDSGMLEKSYQECMEKCDKKVALALGKLLMENTDIATSAFRTQANREYDEMKRLEGMKDYIAQDIKKVEEARLQVWQHHIRVSNEQDRDPDGRPMSTAEIQESGEIPVDVPANS